MSAQQPSPSPYPSQYPSSFSEPVPEAGESPDRADRGLPSDPKELEELIARRRVSLAATVDELVGRARPAELGRRLQTQLAQRARTFATTEDGQVRVERVGAVASAASVVAAVAVLRRRRRRRSR